MAKKFSVVFLRNVPILSLHNRNEVSSHDTMRSQLLIILFYFYFLQLRRLILLVDAMYEARVRLVLLAETDILKLLPLTAQEKQASAFDELFAFDRTVSRLLEMQSAEYLSSIRPVGHAFLFNRHKISLQSLKLLDSSPDIRNSSNGVKDDAHEGLAKIYTLLWNEYNVRVDLDINTDIEGNGGSNNELSNGDATTNTAGSSSSKSVSPNQALSTDVSMSIQDMNVLLYDLIYGFSLRQNMLPGKYVYVKYMLIFIFYFHYRGSESA